MAHTISKPSEDGIVSSLVNRRLSIMISRYLANTRVTPNAVTTASFLTCLVAAFLFGLGQYAAAVVAGLLIQAASIVDGCDGEIARLKSQASPFGAYLDTMLDRYADAAIVVGLSYGYWVRHPHPGVWIVGFLSLAGFMLASYARKEYYIRYRGGPPAGIIQQLSKRDVRLLGIMLGALLGRPYAAMVLLGLMSHISVVWSMGSELKMHNPPGVS